MRRQHHEQCSSCRAHRVPICHSSVSWHTLCLCAVVPLVKVPVAQPQAVWPGQAGQCGRHCHARLCHCQWHACCIIYPALGLCCQCCSARYLAQDTRGNTFGRLCVCPAAMLCCNNCAHAYTSDMCACTATTLCSADMSTAHLDLLLLCYHSSTMRDSKRRWMGCGVRDAESTHSGSFVCFALLACSQMWAKIFFGVQGLLREIKWLFRCQTVAFVAMITITLGGVILQVLGILETGKSNTTHRVQQQQQHHHAATDPPSPPWISCCCDL